MSDGTLSWMIAYSFVNWIFHSDTGFLLLKSQGLCLSHLLCSSPLLSFVHQAGGPAAALSMLVYQPHPCSLSPCPSQPNLPEGLLEELPHDRAEEETLSNTKAGLLDFVWDHYVALFIYFTFNWIHVFKSDNEDYRWYIQFPCWGECHLGVFYQLTCDSGGHSKMAASITELCGSKHFHQQQFLPLGQELCNCQLKWTLVTCSPGKAGAFWHEEVWSVLLWFPLSQLLFPIWFSRLTKRTKELCRQYTAWSDPHSVVFSVFAVGLKNQWKGYMFFVVV